MIGRRTFAGVLAALLLGIAFGQRPADPAEADPARAIAVERRAAHQAEATEDALASLAQPLQAALDEARGGAAGMMGGDEPPGPRLAGAAERLQDATGALAAAHVALERLRGKLAATAQPADGPVLALSRGQLDAIAAQLEGSAATADAFAAMRRSTDDALAALERALIALGNEDPSEALAAAMAARERVAAVGRWEQVLPTMPLWLETADALIDAVADLASALLAGDEEGVDAAAEAYLVAAAEARRADQALAVAFADGRATILEAPLSQLASALTMTEEARAAVASLVHRLADGREHGGELPSAGEAHD